MLPEGAEGDGKEGSRGAETVVNLISATDFFRLERAETLTRGYFRPEKHMLQVLVPPEHGNRSIVEGEDPLLSVPGHCSKAEMGLSSSRS